LLYEARDGSTPAKESPDMASNFDLKPHQEQWRAFTKIMTYSAAGCVAVLVLMALLLL
jgi:hypothetical protein